MTESPANPAPIVARLSSRALVRIAGPDWRGFLQGLLTQDVEGLAPGDIRFAALLTPQGKLLYDLFLIGDGDDCLIDVAAVHRDALVQRLSIYRLRAKVEIATIEGDVLALWEAPQLSSRPLEPGSRQAPMPSPIPAQVAGMTATLGWMRDPRLPALGWRGYGIGAVSAVDEDAYDAHRLALGVPDARDYPPETTYPIEANFDLLHGIDFQKGCFVGQETTSRMKRRGAIKSRMIGLAFEGAPPVFGAELLAGDLRAGEVRGGLGGRALALARLDRITEGALAVDGLTVRVENPGYFPTDES